MTEYISREAAIDAVLGYKGYFQDRLSTNNMILKKEAEVAIDDVPAADVAPVRHGRWKRNDCYESWANRYVCSLCWNHALSDGDYRHELSNYCPNCGAKMDGGADND